MGLSARIDTILNWPKATLTIQQGGAQLPLSKDALKIWQTWSLKKGGSKLVYNHPYKL